MTNDNTAASPGDPIGWFEIGTDDPADAREFYGGLFGWTFMQDGPYSVITTGKDHPLHGGIMDTSAPLPEGTPRTYAFPIAQVADVAASCARAEELHGKVVVPATTVDTGLVYAHITDPAGNLFGLFSPPPA
ncbi:MAG TPA: VOC family protein [Acidimicrobiales bacterium]|jgi:hypothetical protein